MQFRARSSHPRLDERTTETSPGTCFSCWVTTVRQRDHLEVAGAGNWNGHKVAL